MAPGLRARQALCSDRQLPESTCGYKGLDRGSSSWAPIITAHKAQKLRPGCCGR